MRSMRSYSTQVWLEEFLAKEKEVNGVKDEPEEAGTNGESDKAEAAPAGEHANLCTPLPRGSLLEDCSPPCNTSVLILLQGGECVHAPAPSRTSPSKECVSDAKPAPQ